MSTPEIPACLRDFFAGHDNFLLMSHTEPDGDAIGSQLALASFLRRIGKRAGLFSPGPFRRPEIMQWKPLFQERIPASERGSGSAAVILDCSTGERIGEGLASDIEGLPAAVIDHHASGEVFGNCRFVEPTAPSVTYLVLLLIEALGHSPDLEEARFILFGLCTDTGFFRHLGPGSREVFRAVARLTEAGASTQEVHRMVYGGRTLPARHLLGRLLERTEAHFGGRLLLTVETLRDKAQLGIESRDSDMLFQLLQSVSGCEAVALIREEEPGQSSVGLRSRNPVDVGSFARDHGGGGHRNAAGYNRAGDAASVRNELLADMGGVFD